MGVCTKRVGGRNWNPGLEGQKRRGKKGQDGRGRKNGQKGEDGRKWHQRIPKEGKDGREWAAKGARKDGRKGGMGGKGDVNLMEVLLI